MTKCGWVRRYGTSKRVQGIITPRRQDVLRARKNRSLEAMRASNFNDDPAWWERFLAVAFGYHTESYERFLLRKKAREQIHIQESRMPRAHTAQLHAVRAAAMRKMLVAHRKA